MRYLLLVVVLLCSSLFGGIARAGDLLFQITSGKQDLLALIEVTEQEPEATHFRVLFNFPQSKIKVTQTSHIFHSEENPTLRIGSFYLVSLNKERDGFKNAYGIHQVTDRNYRTATLVEPLNGDLAALQWFMNSGGKDTAFMGMGNKMYVEREGIERLIYPSYVRTNASDFSLQNFSLKDISVIYWGMAGMVVALTIFTAFLFSTYFPDKKKILPFFFVDAIIALGAIGYVGWDSGRPSVSPSAPVQTGVVTQDQAIEVVRSAHPELKEYPTDSLPARRIRMHPAIDGWYLAFLQLGSGRPLISAQCFFVGHDRHLEERGSYQPTAETAVFAELDPSSCRASS